MKVTECSKIPSAMDSSGKYCTVSNGPVVGSQEALHSSEELDAKQCSMEGCPYPATATFSSVWNPGTQWSVCDACQWLIDPDALGSDENIPSSAFHAFRNGVKEASLCVLRETTMSTMNNANLPLKDSSYKHEQKVVPAVPVTSYMFEKVLSFRKLTGKRIKKCNIDGCNLGACSLWTTWKRNDDSSSSDNSTRKPIYVCVDCQEEKLGGWPNLTELLGKGYMTETKIDLITRRCSKQSHPTMPPPFIKDLP